ncbi:hypothetical protein [Parapedobacter sp. DT-150]|uniref:hypothetical protein n=1 Tax=Parapedobacter sp. DT-150 TaxID=3396162 RepID=UPI003F1B8F82
MKATKNIVFVFAALIFVQQELSAQESPYRESGIAVEARVTTYLQSGYDLALYYHPQKTKFSFGLLVASHNINGNTKEILFTGDNFDNMDIHLDWIASALTRYHFSRHGEGFFGEIGIGVEEFTVSQNEISISNTNGFVAPSIGYIWYPWNRSGFYALPKATAALIISRPEEQHFASGDNFRIRPAFVTPSFAIGWKFDFRKK